MVSILPSQNECYYLFINNDSLLRESRIGLTYEMSVNPIKQSLKIIFEK